MRKPFFAPEAWGPLAASWEAFQEGDHQAALEVHADDGEMESMPVSLFFRGREGLRDSDREALSRVGGRILDGGAGVGSIALLLQEDGFSVTALEVIPEGVEIMRERGVEDPREGRLEDLSEDGAFDTILLLMNGSALAGTLSGLPPLLGVLKGLLAKGGQLLMDSTDLLQGEVWELEGGEEGDEGGYPGEIHYQMEFQGSRGAPFPQLFLDPRTLRLVAEREGWSTEVVWEGEGGEYLVRLMLQETAGED
jgi:SAM-dependent methyltransferase